TTLELGFAIVFAMEGDSLSNARRDLTNRWPCFRVMFHSKQVKNLVHNRKQYLFTLALVGCLWLALILGCTRLRGNSNSEQTTLPASPTNTATTSSPPRASTNSPNTASGPTTTAGVTMANFN